MAQEIERKFLLKRFPYELYPYKPRVNVKQGYLSVDPNYEVRITSRLYLTSKVGAGLSRTEINTKITQENFDILWPLTDGKRVEKIRHFYPLNNGTLLAEIDEYVGANQGLITVEVEFPNEEEANLFSPPDWFGEEVTFEKKYKNAQLAK